MYKIYSVESRKGGVGKTTIALNLAKALVKKKYDVLLIDCDITGTPITRAAINSSFWNSDVVVSKNNGVPYNLIDFYSNTFLRGYNKEKEIIEGLDLNPKKIHLIGSEIYDEDGSLIIDPRDLMDDLHSYWFLDLIKNIANLFCEATAQDRKAIVLDNSPGYVGIGRSIREWLTKEGPDKSTFVLVSSLDEQDIESTISSAAEIQKMMMTDKDINSYVKVIVNKVPDDLITESGGYEFNVEDGSERKALVDLLFPIDKHGYPKNIIKYDTSISGQFIEASLKPKSTKNEEETDLESAIRKLEKKAANYEQKQDQFADITSLDIIYKELLKALSNRGYVRLSKALKGDLMPNYMLKNLNSIIGQLGSMAHPNLHILEFTKKELKEAGLSDLYRFMDDRGLAPYSSIFISLYNGIYKVAGFDRKGANNFQMFNLNIMLAAFYAVQKEYYLYGYDYREFLKQEIDKKNTRKFDTNLLVNGIIAIIGYQFIEVDAYIANLLNAYFNKFNQAICYTLIRMIDCTRDYDLLVDACKATIFKGAKMMSEDLTKYLKAVISKKTEEPDDVKYRQLVKEPYEMKAIQSVMKNLVLEK